MWIVESEIRYGEIQESALLVNENRQLMARWREEMADYPLKDYRSFTQTETDSLPGP
jgi:hypothetical protein